MMNSFDQIVGKIAGSIFSDITNQFPLPPLMLIPALTFKVKKTLERVADINLLSVEQKSELAKDIQISIIPLLFSYDIDASVIEQVTPAIESAALKALMQNF